MSGKYFDSNTNLFYEIYKKIKFIYDTFILHNMNYVIL